MPSVVDGESAVLPAPAAFDLDDPAASLLDEPELDLAEPSISRPSRPFIDKDWVDEDHYFDGDLPTDQYGSGDWKETYKDIDEIQFNGSIRRHWKRGQNEVRQVIAQCRKVIGRDDVRREDLSRHFYGIQSPLEPIVIPRGAPRHVRWLPGRANGEPSQEEHGRRGKHQTRSKTLRALWQR